MSVDELLKAVDNLSEPDLDDLVKRALFVRARRKTNVLTAAETELLLEINQGIPAKVHDRYEILLEKRDHNSFHVESMPCLIQAIVRKDKISDGSHNDRA